MHPADMVFFWAKADPERLAVIRLDMAITYRGLAEAIHSISERIDRLGLKSGMPVAVAIGNPAERLAVCFALLRAGIAVAPIDMGLVSRLTSNDLNTLICDQPGQVPLSGRNIRFDPSWIQNDGRALPWDSRPSRAIDTDLIFFTSGTTGTPKKNVTPSHALMERVALLPVTGEGHGSRILIIPGLNSAFGFTRAAVRLYAGMTCCFATSYEAQLRLIETFNVDTVVGSPQQVLGLVEFAENNSKHRLPSLKDVRIGGGFASGDLVRRVQARLCHNVWTEYGATETGLIAFARYDSIASIPSAVGLPAPGVSVEIVDPNNNPLPNGTEGLVRVRTTQFQKSLAANSPELAGQAERTWWYPGDVGHLTADGILCVGGRVDDVINCGGAKVSALALDEVVCRFPGIKDGAVCGVRGRSGLEEVWIGVSTDADVDVDALTRSLDESQGFKLGVGEVLVVEQIPRNQLGKIQRHKLKEVLLGMKARAS